MEIVSLNSSKPFESDSNTLPVCHFGIEIGVCCLIKKLNYSLIIYISKTLFTNATEFTANTRNYVKYTMKPHASDVTIFETTLC